MSTLSGEPSPIQTLYRQVVLDHYRTPRNRAPLTQPDASALLHNPLCGDQVEVQVSLTQGRIRDISARARGCSIVVATGSVMSELARGADRSTVAELRARLERLIRGELSEEELDGLDERLRAFARIAEVPARQRCATLPWEALGEALAQALSPS